MRYRGIGIGLGIVGGLAFLAFVGLVAVCVAYLATRISQDDADGPFLGRGR